MQRSKTFREALEASSREVDLKELAQLNKTGRAMTFRTLETIMVEALENVLLNGMDDPALTGASLRGRAREELRRLIAAYRTQDSSQVAAAGAA